MRPLGAVVLDAYIDDVGRRKGLIVNLSIMASGTILIVRVPLNTPLNVPAGLPIASAGHIQPRPVTIGPFSSGRNSLIDHVRDEGPGAQCSTRLCWRNQAHLGHVTQAHFVKVHTRPGLQADRFEAGLQLSMGIQLCRTLMATQTEVFSSDQHHRHAVVECSFR